MSKRTLLFIPLLCLFSACSKDTVDDSEIADIFKRHSYAQEDASALKTALKDTGVDALPGFDPHAMFFYAGWQPERPRAGTGKAGVGLYLWKDAGAVRVIRVLQGSPAQNAGIAAGDRVDQVDGKEALQLPDAVLGASIFGAPGGVLRFTGTKGGGGALNAALKRDFGGLPTVWGFNIPGTRTGYLRVVSFTAKSASRMRAELNDVLDRGASSVIIDLRHNFGGSLEELAQALSLFAPGKGPVFKVASRHPGYSKVFSAAGPGPFAGVKAVVLTDAGTISRAEIFAATLKEWGSAVIMGAPTAGNVSLTRSFRLKDGGALRLTVARLLTPAGADLEGKGLAPDVALDTRLPGSQTLIGEFPPVVASSDPLLRRALAGN